MNLEDILKEVKDKLISNDEIVLPTGLRKELRRLYLKNPESYEKGKNGLVNSYRNQRASVKAVDYNDSSLAYAVFYMPRNIPKVINGFYDLLRGDLIKDHMRVLDLGAATGTSYFGIARFLEVLNETYELNDIDREISARYWPVDKFKENIDRFSKIYKNLSLDEIVEYSSYWNIDLSKSRLKKQNPFDVIILSNFINEINDYSNIIKTLDEHLAADGSVIVIETADGSGTRKMQSFKKNLLLEGYNQYSPNSIWTPECLSSRCNFCSYAGTPVQDIGVADIRTDVGYIYAIFRKDNKNIVDPKALNYIKRHASKLSDIVKPGSYDLAFYRLSKERHDHFDGSTIYRVFSVCDGTNGNDDMCIVLDQSRKIDQDIINARKHTGFYLKNAKVVENFTRNRVDFNITSKQDSKLYNLEHSVL